MKIEGPDFCYESYIPSCVHTEFQFSDLSDRYGVIRYAIAYMVVAAYVINAGMGLVQAFWQPQHRYL